MELNPVRADPHRYVVHAVGPIWHGGGDQEDAKLHSAVLNSLEKAEELQARSIALPAISSGIFGTGLFACACACARLHAMCVCVRCDVWVWVCVCSSQS
jgi:O-acetyl-ADP-ribose deacetylase (regulator of RNase III)